MEKDKFYLTRNSSDPTLSTGGNFMADEDKDAGGGGAGTPDLSRPVTVSQEQTFGSTKVEVREANDPTNPSVPEPEVNLRGVPVEAVETIEEDLDEDKSIEREAQEAGVEPSDSPEEVQRKIKDYRKKEAEKKTAKAIEVSALLKNFQNINNEQEAREAFRSLLLLSRQARGRVKHIPSELTKELDSLVREFDKDQDKKINALSLDEIKNRAKKLGDAGLAELFVGVEKETQKQEQPRCLEELVELIMESEEEVWGPNGEKSLMNEDGTVNVPHLLSYFRGRMDYYHNFNPDADVNFWSMVQIPSLYRSYGFGELIDHTRYWRSRTLEKGSGKLKITYKKQDEYWQLREQLLMEAYLFGASHNNDVRYRAVMGVEEKCIETIAQQYAGNEYAKNKDRLWKVLRHPSSGEIAMITKRGDKKIDPNATGIEAVRERYINDLKEEGSQGTLGRLIRRSILAYYYLREVELEEGKKGEKGEKLNPPIENMFRKVLGPEGMNKFYDSIVTQILKEEFKDEAKQVEDEYGDSQNLAKEAAKARNEKYKSKKFDMSDPDQRNKLIALVKDKIPGIDLASKDIRNTAFTLMKNYGYANSMKDLNLFNAPNKVDKLVTLVKKAITEGVAAEERASLRKRLVDYGMGDYPELIDQLMTTEDSEYATDWAFSTTYWTGIAASNDTEAVGFNAWSKLINAKEYRLKQSRGRGVYGEMFNIFGIRRLSLNFWEGMNVRKEGNNDFDQNLLEVLQGGQGDDVNLHEGIEDFEFEGNVAQAFFANNHVRNGYLVFKALTEEHGMGIEKIIKVENGKIVIDQKAFDKLKDEDWKHIRYWIDQGKFQMGNKVRYFWKDPRIKGNATVFGSMPLMQALVSEDVLRMGMYNRKGFEDELKPKVVNGKVVGYIPERIGRNVFAYLIAKEIWLKTRYETGFPKLNNEQVREMAELLEKFWPYDIEEAPDGNVHIKSSFFDHHEIKKILRVGGRAHMTRSEVLGGGLGGFATGLRESFVELGKGILKTVPS